MRFEILRLLPPGGIQGYVGAALCSPFQVPIRLAVAREIDSKS